MKRAAATGAAFAMCLSCSADQWSFDSGDGGVSEASFPSGDARGAVEGGPEIDGPGPNDRAPLRDGGPFGQDFDVRQFPPPCTSDDECVFGGRGSPMVFLHCDRMSGLCVECTQTKGQCSLSTPVCNTSQNRCVQCNLNEDCDAGQICHMAGHQCLTACSLDGGGCPSSDQQCVPAGYCASCTDDFQCLGSRAGSFCPVNRCVECFLDSQCLGNQLRRYCDLNTNRCVGCLTNLDCFGRSYCDPQVHTCLD